MMENLHRTAEPAADPDVAMDAMNILATTVKPSATPVEVARRRLVRFFRIRGVGVLCCSIILFVVLSIQSEFFFTKTNLLNLLDQSSTIGIMACAGTLVLIAGGLDLSTEATFAITGIITAKLVPDLGVYPAMLVGVLSGLVIGAAIGVVVTVGRVNSLIGTLGAQIVIRGFATALAAGTIIAVSDPSFTTLGGGAIDGLSYRSIIWLVFALLCGLVLWKTTYGRFLYAVGGNREAARLSGIRINLIQGSTFAISGLAAAIAGVLVTSQVSNAQSGVGEGYALTVLAAIVIGGTSIFGGEGSIWRTMNGVLLLTMIANGLTLLGVGPVYALVIQGAILIFAVGLDAWTTYGRRST